MISRLARVPAARWAAPMVLTLLAAPAMAQDDEDDDEPRRTRVAFGPQLVPSFPGSSDVALRPFGDVARVRGDQPFPFEAPDESFGFSVLRSGGFSLGPAFGFEGERSVRDLGTALPRVGFTVEVGLFGQYQVRPDFRIRAEGRSGLGGHHGWVGTLGADYVYRDGDEYLVSAGPRVTFANGRHHRAYFGVAAEDASGAGLQPFRPTGGVQAVGGTVGLLRQLTPRWGLYGYAKYDRLIRDAGRSPVVRSFGSRDQFSAGLAASYTFQSSRD